MEIMLPPELEKFVEKQVSSGNYESADEVILASLNLLVEQTKSSQPQQSYKPQNILGQRLWQIRQRAIASGMNTVSADAIASDLSMERDRGDRYENLS